MKEIIENLYKKDNWNDDLLNTLLDSLSNMKSKDIITVELKYSDVSHIIRLLIQDNINANLCEKSIRLGLDQRKKDREENINERN